ncbi:metal dependent amidohydrolase [Biscogniauxia marginata]|nr:metal dependent amidohydrolase [Biscogniauxia marginata]
MGMPKLLQLPSLFFLGLASASGCRVTRRGLSGDLIIRGTVLTSEAALSNTTVHVHTPSGKIAYVGNGCDSGLRAVDASVIECGDSIISPGFINTHEHIEYSTVNPLPDIGERVDHRHDWRVGARGRTLRPAPVNGSEIDATAWGELRHIFSGTTSVVGGAMVTGLARNLDFISGLEDGLTAPAAAWDVFPLDDSTGILRDGDCNYGSVPIDREMAGRFNRYIAHVGEGVDGEAANEFACLANMTFDTVPAASGGGLSTDIIAPNLALVHALGLTAANFDMIAARGAKIVWSPRSNVFLYGKTMNVSYLLEAGITVALGTDWLPSGSATMNREAVCGASVMKESYDMIVEPKTLWEMMTINAAMVAGFEDELGSLEVNKMADIVVFNSGNKAGSDSHEESGAFARAVFGVEEEIELVMRGGKILVASDGIKDLTTETCETLTFGETNKTICISDELGSSFEEFEASLQGVYSARLPAIPPHEPTCKPKR